ncbi:MAG: CopD family protein [Rhodobacteraceae bacterium]|nr:CopD family protein [Paracoccaceae bacterium]MBL4557431.1 CopD family protein [Paracoccaceae bacterium]
MIGDWLQAWYPWIKTGHVVSIIAWMAALFYLPRLFVYHTERAAEGPALVETLEVMEWKLQRFIMRPAMHASWGFGLLLVFTPYVVDWSLAWPWVKATAVVAMTWFHWWLTVKRVELAEGRCTMTGRGFRFMNEVPTVLMLAIVSAVIVRY